MEFVGKIVQKSVDGGGILTGTVKSHNSSSGLLEIVFEDGHCEEMEVSEVVSLLEIQPEVVKVKTRVGREPKKRHRTSETTSCSGSGSDNLVAGSEISGILNGGDESSGGNDGDVVGNGNGSSGSDEKVGSENRFGFEEISNLNGGVSDINYNGICVKDGVDLNGSVNLNDNGIRVKDGVDLNARVNLNENEGVSDNDNGICVKDDIDLNARVNLNEDMDLNDVCDLNFDNEGGLERREGIDLNLDVNVDEGVNLDANLGGEMLRRECKFDLNVGVCEEVKEVQGCAEGNGHFVVDGETGQLREVGLDVEHRSMEVDGVRGDLDCVSDAVKSEEFRVSVENIAEDASLCFIEEKESHDGKENAAAIGSPMVLDGLSGENVAAIDSPMVLDGVSVRDCDYVSLEAGVAAVDECQDDPGSPCKQESSQRKRRKVSNNPKATPETALRRSSRRVSARKQVQVTDDPLSSLETSVTEEKPSMPGSEKYEQCNVPILKLQLPPSSQNLHLDDIPVLEFFSVYAYLTSFSTLLFLSPFELEDFVAALKSEIPSILLDNIHVSILHTLRKHLEFLSSEGCQSASICLRYMLF